MALLRNDKFRFSLQWGRDTEERLHVGNLLERLGNKKSDLVVLAVSEYLRKHPEIEAPDTKIKITYQPLQTKEQMLDMVKSMTKSAIEELLAERKLVPATEDLAADAVPSPSEQDLDAMVAGLKLFDF